MRQFIPYEINHLIKFGFDPFEVSKTADEYIPVEYITEKAEFYGNIFEVNKNTLIPRIETEQLINIGLELVDKKNIVFTDIGTGSGAIAISFAKQLLENSQSFEGYLSDSSDSAILIAKKNIDTLFSPLHQNCFTNKIKNSQLKIIKSDLLEHYPKNKLFNIIFANLPYIPSSRINKLNSSVKDYEPLAALDGGMDGLNLIRKLLSKAEKYLTKDGYLLLEVDDTHDEKKSEEFKDKWKIEVRRDLNEKIRFWICEAIIP